MSETAQDCLFMTRSDMDSQYDDFMNLSVSAEEAAEFDFDAPSSQTAAPDRSLAPVGTVLKAGPNESASWIPKASENKASDGADVEMRDVTVENGQSASVVDPPRSRSTSSVSGPARELAGLYRSLAMDLEASQVLMAKYRLDTLHLRGVDEMSTHDVMQYFASYKPAKLEWVNDTSCNVVFEDEISAASALKTLTRPLKVTKKPLTSEVPPAVFDPDTGEEILLSDAASFPIPVPAGTWRAVKVVPPTAKHVIVRYARTIDKKPPNAQRFSSYYTKYGNPNSGFVAPLEVQNDVNKKRSWIRRGSMDEVEDHEPYGLYVKPITAQGRVLEVDQRSSNEAKRLLGLHTERQDSSPFVRPRAGSFGGGSFSENSRRGSSQSDDLSGQDLRSLLQSRTTIISDSDLRHRLSAPNIQPLTIRRSDSDLRDRLNKMKAQRGRNF